MSFRTARARTEVSMERGEMSQEFYSMDLFASMEKKNILI